MTNQQGVPEALRPIARYKIGYHTDEWGMRSSTPSGIPDHAGAWVRYEDHVAALQAQRPAPSVAVALSDDLRDRLVAISEAIADQDDRAAQAMLREILAAPQPSPTPQADSAQEAPNAMQSLTAALKADPEYAWAWHCNLAMPIMDNAKVSHRVANITAARLMQHLFGIDTEKHPHFEVADEAPQADSQAAPVVDSAAGRYRDECTQGGRCLGGCLNSEPCYLKVRAQTCSVPTPTHAQIAAYLEATGAYVTNDATREAAIAEAISADRAARAPADSVTAPAGGAVAGPEDVQRARRIAAEAQRWIGDRTHLGALIYLDDLAWALKTLASAPTPPAQAADSVLDDAARLDFLIKHRAYVVSEPDACPGYWLHFFHKETGKCWTQIDEHQTPRAAIDAARKQGANHD